MRTYEAEIQNALLETYSRKGKEIDVDTADRSGNSGLSAGIIVAGGLFSFIIELGILADFADRTHTGDHVLLYEDAAALAAQWGTWSSSTRFRCQEEDRCWQFLDCLPGSLQDAGLWLWRRC